MSKKPYNYITLVKTPTSYEIYDNIYNQHLISIERSGFLPYYPINLINDLASFISDLEEMSFRLDRIVNDYCSNKITQTKFNSYSQFLYEEIGARFNHYFQAEDTPMIADIIKQIYNNSRSSDSIYEYFTKHSLAYIQRKTKQKNHFSSLNRNLKSFDESIDSYISNAMWKI